MSATLDPTTTATLRRSVTSWPRILRHSISTRFDDCEKACGGGGSLSARTTPWIPHLSRTDLGNAGDDRESKDDRAERGLLDGRRNLTSDEWVLRSLVSDDHGSVESSGDGSGGDSIDGSNDRCTSPPLKAESELAVSGAKIIPSGAASGVAVGAAVMVVAVVLATLRQLVERHGA